MAIILSGGGAERMAGIDKGLQLYLDQPLVKHVINAIAKQVDQALISINRNQAEYKKFGLKLVTDQVPLYQGPLAGVRAGIKHIQPRAVYDDYRYVLVTTCDTPNLPTDLVVKLESGLQDAEKLVAVVNDGEQNQNLHCLIHRDAWQSLLNFYADGGRAMHLWLQQIGVAEVDFSDQRKAFTNINTLDQLADN